nr:immunoglobulin light chain junction region [Macaca mulatta]
CQHHNSHPWTF